MHYYTAMYTTFADAYKQYCKNISKYEKEYNYMRNIVCSVPENDIKPNCYDVPVTKWDEPG